MSKAYKVWEITKQKMNEISRNGESWMNFLHSASYTSKYNFAEQVTLYAYRPYARACATMETWNKVFNHWVNKGAKGIPIPDFSTETPRLKYVFDISDTHPTIYTKRTPEIWECSEDYEQAYKDIEKIYNIDSILPLEDRVVDLVDNLVEERFYDYSLEINEVIKGSYIEGVDQSEVNQMSRILLKNSTS